MTVRPRKKGGLYHTFAQVWRRSVAVENTAPEMEPWCRKVRRPGGVYRVEVVESGIRVRIGIQPGTVVTRLRAGYSRDDSGQRDQSKTKEEGESHLESRGKRRK